MIDLRIPILAATAVMLLGAAFTVSLNTLLGGQISPAPIAAKHSDPPAEHIAPATKPVVHARHRHRASHRPARLSAERPQQAPAPVGPAPRTTHVTAPAQSSPPPAAPVTTAPVKPAQAAKPSGTPPGGGTGNGNFYDTG